MSAVKLIYFEGCPNSKHARAVLLSSQIDFEVIRQDDLPDEDHYRHYSSPTILRNGKIIFGERLEPNASACSAEKFDEELLKSKLLTIEGASKKGFFASIGSFGSALVVGLCPVCIPAIGALLSSIGLGFLINEKVLKPVLIIFLATALSGFLWSYLKEHKKIGPLLMGIIMGGALYIGRYIYIGPTLNLVLMYGGIAGILGASVWNIFLRKKVPCAACKVEA